MKEGFKILIACEGYEELCEFYAGIDEEMCMNSRVKFYYLQALGRSGKAKEAYEMMEANGGLMLDDLREGEDTLAGLWTELHEKVYGEKGEIPHQYRFMAFE